MRSVSIRLSDLDGGNKLIPIGFQGENEYTTVNIDCKKIFDQHPTAVPVLAVTPPQGDSYPAVVVRDGDIVSWTVCDSDLVYEGNGAFQLTFVIDGTVIGKTYKARTKVLGSIEPSGEVPSAIQNWLIQAAAALQALPTEVANSVAALIGAMVGVGETLDPDESVTVTYDAENNTLTIGVPKGKDGHDGQDGHTPVISAQKVGKVTTLYVDGVAIATVNDGQDGAGIDDTQISTGTTWSSKKIDDENLSLKTEISSKYTKPQTGIPASDIAPGVIPSLDPEDITEAVNEWLTDNITNPDSPPLDRSLSVPAAAAPADLVGEVKKTIDETIKPVRTAVPKPHQLWNKAILQFEPYLTENRLYINTSTRGVSNNNKCRVYAVEVNGSSGEKYSYNLLNGKTFADYGISTAYIHASNKIPEVGDTVLQVGSYNETYYRGSITLAQASKYVVICLYGADFTDADDAKVNCDAFMSNTVVRKGNNDTTYYDYEEISKYTSDAVTYKETGKLYVGDNIITGSNVTAGTNWTGDFTNGYTHSSGASGDLSISIPNTANVKYLVKFKQNPKAESSLFVVVGNNPEIDTYRETAEIAIGIISDDSGIVKFRAVSNFATTITEIGVYPIKEDGTGTEVEVEGKNVDFGEMPSRLTAFWNVAIGNRDTQSSNVNGSRNVAIGLNSQKLLRQGTRNVCVGTFSMAYVKNGERNIAIGSDSLYSPYHVNTDNQAFDNIAMGYAAMSDGSMVKQNVAVGSRSMQYSEEDAIDNVSIGYNAGNYAHKFNTFVGKRAGYYTKGNHNVAVGREAGADLYVTGEKNVSIGSNAGFDNTGASGASPKTIDNSIAIGFNVKAKDSNQAWIGNSSQTIILAGKKIVFNNDGTVTWEELT